MTAATTTAVQVSPLSGWTGALISGVDLSAPLSDTEVDAIRAALHRWKVVFFRDQQLDHAAQISFGAQFGSVTPGHPYEGDSAPADFPQIHTVSPAAYDHRYGTRYRKKQSPNGPGWHADVTPLINPPSHSILRAEVVPPYGGDTQFTNVAAVYAGLSPPCVSSSMSSGPSIGSVRPFRPNAATRRSATSCAVEPAGLDPSRRARASGDRGARALRQPVASPGRSSACRRGRAGMSLICCSRRSTARSTRSGSSGSPAASHSGTTGPPCTWRLGIRTCRG